MSEARRALIDSCPFKAGDRVLHKSGGSAKRGADARVGIIRAVRRERLEQRAAFVGH